MQANDLLLIRLLAYTAMRFGAHDKAQTLYAALLALDPADLGAARGQAWAWLEAGRPREALARIDTLEGPDEPRPVSQLLRARALAQLGRGEDADVAMKAFLALRARDAGANGGRP